MALPGAIMTEERLREIEKTRCTHVYLSPDDVPELIAEIRRLQYELAELRADRDCWRLLAELKHAELDKAKAEVDRLKKKLDAMSWKHVEALDCLADLHAVQNGCPLPEYEQDWTAAMRRAERLLGIEAKAGDDGDNDRG